MNARHIGSFRWFASVGTMGDNQLSDRLTAATFRLASSFSSFVRKLSASTIPLPGPVPSGPMALREMSPTLQFTPTTPLPLFPAAPMVPAT